MLIVFEGAEGSGKSTQIELLGKALEKRSIPYVKTREPGGTPACEELRGLFLKHDWNQASELLLIWAMRVQHLNEVIIPSIKKGLWVLCDRFIYSTRAYQTQNTLCDHNLIMKMEELFLSIRPDHVFFLDIGPSLVFDRIQKRKAPLNRYDSKDFAFHSNIISKFRELFSKNLESVNIHRIDGEQSQEKVSEQVVETLFSASFTKAS